MASLSTEQGRCRPSPGIAKAARGPLSRAEPLERRLRDGTPVRLRLLDARDRERLREGFEHLSPQSRYRRFFTAIPKLTEAMLDRLSETDDWNHVAVGAERGGLVLGRRPGLGVARFIRLADAPDTAELAVAIVDDLQGRGLGRLLVETLCHVARARDVRRLRALVLPENVAMQGLLRDLDPNVETGLEDGLRVFTLEVPSFDLGRIGRTSSRSLAGLGADVLALGLSRLDPRRLRSAPGSVMTGLARFLPSRS